MCFFVFNVQVITCKSTTTAKLFLVYSFPPSSQFLFLIMFCHGSRRKSILTLKMRVHTTYNSLPCRNTSLKREMKLLPSNFSCYERIKTVTLKNPIYIADTSYTTCTRYQPTNVVAQFSGVLIYFKIIQSPNNDFL